MKDQARRQLLPGWTKIYCLALAIGLVSGVKDLFTVTKAYMERWQELIRWVALGDMLFRAVGIPVSYTHLGTRWKESRTGCPAFLSKFIVIGVILWRIYRPTPGRCVPWARPLNLSLIHI